MAIQRPKKHYNKNPIRRKAVSTGGAANRRGTRTPITFTMGSSTTTTNTCTFNQPVSLKGFPAWFDTSTPTIVVTGAVQLTTNTIAVTWNSAPSVAISVPFEDPAIRNANGGYVNAGSVTFP
jgi:hypothetical protein